MFSRTDFPRIQVIHNNSVQSTTIVFSPNNLLWMLVVQSSGITGVKRTTREEKGARTFSLERSRGREQSCVRIYTLCSSSLLSVCVASSHYLSFPSIPWRGLRQKRAAPGACSTAFGCLSYVSGEVQSVNCLHCFCCFSPFAPPAASISMLNPTAVAQLQLKKKNPNLEFPNQSNLLGVW